ncbi:MAG: hypothetical protein AAFV85_07710 [Cyanobacteria bacterium J06634_6]
MAQQLKRWESPRRKGRNHKGRGGSAKQRQYKKRQKLLMKRLQKGIEGSGQASIQPKRSNKDSTSDCRKGSLPASLFLFPLG